MAAVVTEEEEKLIASGTVGESTKEMLRDSIVYCKRMQELNPKNWANTLLCAVGITLTAAVPDDPNTEDLKQSIMEHRRTIESMRDYVRTMVEAHNELLMQLRMLEGEGNA